MNNRQAIVLAVVFVIGIGAVFVLTLRAFAPPNDAPTPPIASTAAAPVDTPLQQSPAAATPAHQAPAPWLAPPPDDTGAVAENAEGVPPQRRQQMAKLQASLQSMLAVTAERSDRTHQSMRDALDALEAMDDPAVTSQIDLGAVRHNLEISVRMQALAQQLQQLSARPDGPERQQRIDAGIAELRRLQSQMRTDVRAPGSTLPELLPAPAVPAAAQ